MNARARIAVACAAIVGITAVSGCAAQSSSAPGPVSPSTVSPSAVSSSAVPDRAAVLVDEHDNNATVRVVEGVNVVLTLHSTYWMNVSSSQPSVVREDGQPGVQPRPSGCVPGEGCGDVVATFSAVGVGTATLTASRTSCGEAMACGPKDSHYQVTILVVAH